MTVRILTSRQEDTNWTGAGTGFLYMFSRTDKQAPVLVTNKHVLDGAKVVGLTFHVTEDDNETAIAGAGRMISIRSKELLIIRHPDPDVDLAAFAIAPIIDHALKHEGWHPFIKCLDKSSLPSEQMTDDLGSLEDIVMVGYPTGIVDLVNNFPVVRRGVTATPYGADYQGKCEFLADIPVYRGSSGSPIFIVNEGGYTTKSAFVVGKRFALIGVLYAGHMETVDGHIVKESIPTSLAPTVRVKNMINLGICVKSKIIEDMSFQIPGL